MKFLGKIAPSGKLTINKQDEFLKFNRSLARPNIEVEVILEVSKKKKRRSPNQSDTLHGWNKALADETGMDVDEMKRETKRRCGLGTWSEFGGRKKFNPISTADFTLEQGKLFMAEQEKIAIFLSEENAEFKLPYDLL